jgi:hypothetical protein
VANVDHVVLCVLVLLCRIGLCFAAIFVLWDIKAVFYAIWQPFDWLVGYTDPRKGAQDRLHGEHTHIVLPVSTHTHTHTRARAHARAFPTPRHTGWWCYVGIALNVHGNLNRRQGTSSPDALHKVWA